jgi:hypothetical protein
MRKIIIFIGLLFTILAIGCEYQEGTVKYDDCREIVHVKPGSWRLYVHQFICDYTKRDSGKIVGGTCVYVDTESRLFSSSSKCKTAYIYNFENGPDKGCTKEYPYLGYDNKCYQSWYAADMSKLSK